MSLHLSDRLIQHPLTLIRRTAQVHDAAQPATARMTDSGMVEIRSAGKQDNGAF